MAAVEVKKTIPKEAISVRNLLERTYDLLAENGGRIVFPHPVFVRVVSDYDPNRERYGQFEYKTADICQFGGKRFAISRGEKVPYYLTDGLDSDIVAFELPEGSGRLNARVEESLREGEYFRNSLIIGHADGEFIRFEPSYSKFNNRMLELAAGQIPAFKFNTDEKKTLYLPQLAAVLAGTIDGLLSTL